MSAETDPSAKRKKIAHVVASVVILLHAFEKWDHHSSTWWIFLFFGLLALGLVAKHAWLHQRFPAIDAAFFLIEGTLMFVTAYYYFNIGKTYLPYCYVLAGLVYVFITFYKHRKLSR